MLHRKTNFIRFTLLSLENSVRNYQGQERERRCNLLRVIVGAIALLFSPLPFSSLVELFQVPERDIQQTLHNLHSILSIPEDKAQLVRLHHPSFRDSLLSSERRCNDFWMDDKQGHWVLAKKCLQLMSILKQDICGLCTPGILMSDIDISQVKGHLFSEVQYVCLHWIQHVLKSGNELHDSGLVHEFLKNHFLHWLEAMASIGKTTEGVHAIAALKSLIKHQKSSSVKRRRFIPTAMGAFFNRHTKMRNYMHLFMMQRGLLYLISRLFELPLFRYTIQPSICTRHKLY
jgi:hypothetical protein